MRITRKHGLSQTPEYRAWQTMLQRCHNPEHRAYPRYGGRGITVCDRWRDSLEAFVADMGPRPSPQHELDRRDNDAGYSPENCRWVTRTVNSRNRRSNVMLTHDGETLCLAEWCDRLGLPTSTVTKRIAAGWSHAAALTTPVQVRGLSPDERRARDRDRAREKRAAMTPEERRAMDQKRERARRDRIRAARALARAEAGA